MSLNGENDMEKAENEKNASFQTPKKIRLGKKERNDPTRFQGMGVNFNGKIIGIEPVPDARGDKMCQDAMAKLKMVVKAAGEHKQRIIINVSLEGLKIFDQRSGAVLHHHAVHKISFISRDVTDARAFGYVYSTGDGNHEFFGIKTEKAAEGLVLTLRDLFQVVFEMKKREVEEAKKQKEEKDTKEKTETSDTPKASETQESQDIIGEKVEEKKQEGTLLDLESELNNLQEGINQMSAFDGSDLSSPSGLSLGRGSPWTSSPQPTSSAGSSPFPVRFDAGQSDPFATTQPVTSQQAMPAQNAPAASLGTDLFAGGGFGQQPAASGSTGGFGTFPSQTPSPQLGAQQPLAQAAAPDPFKSDPFFTGAASTPPVQPPPQGDKFAALSSLSQPQQQSSGGNVFSGGSDFFGSSSMPSTTAAPSGSNLNPGFAMSPLQPLGSPQAAAQAQPKSGGGLFSDLDPVGGNKPAASKQDFFKEGPKPSMNQLGTSGAPPPTGIFGQPQQQSPFGTTVSGDPFDTARFSSPALDKIADPFDTSSILQQSLQQGPFDTSQLKPKSFESPPPPLHKPRSPTCSTSSNEELFDDDISNSSPEKPPPRAPPPPLPRQITVDLSQAPAPPPRPSMVRHATVDLGDVTPPPVPRRPPATTSPLPTNPSLQVFNPPLPPRNTPPVKASPELPVRTEPVSKKGTFQRQASLPVKPGVSSPSAVARPRPRPRPRTPAGGSSALTVVKSMEAAPSASDSFIRDTMTRSSDKCDAHIAAKRVAEQNKSLVRNQSEPTMNPKNSVSGEIDPFSVNLSASNPASTSGDKRSISSSSSAAKTPDPFADDLNSDPFATTDPFTSPTDPFSEEFVDKSDLFKTKAVSLDVGTETLTPDPFGGDPFAGDDVFASQSRNSPNKSNSQSQSNQNHITTADSGKTASTSSALSELTKDQSDPFAEDPFSSNQGDSHSDSVSVGSSKSPSNNANDCKISHSFSTNFSDLSISQIASDSATGKVENSENKELASESKSPPSLDPASISSTNGLPTSAESDCSSAQSDPFGTFDPFKYGFSSPAAELKGSVSQSMAGTVDPFSTNQNSDPFIVTTQLSDPFLVSSNQKPACTDLGQSNVNIDSGTLSSQQQQQPMAGGLVNGGSPFGGMPGAMPLGGMVPPPQQPQPSSGNPFAPQQWQ